jgi:hypothetical protein
MWARINFLLGLIEEAGSNGIEVEKLVDIMVLNGMAAERKVKEYLKRLERFGKITILDNKCYPANIKTRQAQLDNYTKPASFIHTDAHIEDEVE